MTNAELITKIKSEIERRKNNAETLRERNICLDILDFIDYLESEKPMNQDEDLEEEIERIVKCEKEFMNFKFKSQLIGYIARQPQRWDS